MALFSSSPFFLPLFSPPPPLFFLCPFFCAAEERRIGALRFFSYFVLFLFMSLSVSGYHFRLHGWFDIEFVLLLRQYRFLTNCCTKHCNQRSRFLIPTSHIMIHPIYALLHVRLAQANFPPTYQSRPAPPPQPPPAINSTGFFITEASTTCGLTPGFLALCPIKRIF